MLKRKLHILIENDIQLEPMEILIAASWDSLIDPFSFPAKGRAEWDCRKEECSKWREAEAGGKVQGL